MYSDWLGEINDSQATNRSAPDVEEVLAGNPPCFLLVIWGSYMTPSHTETHFFIAIQIRVAWTPNNVSNDGLIFETLTYCPHLTSGLNYINY